ncbi:hypothetical protein DPC6316_1109 [Bifidobacterium longum]|nr:hypothetical protein DPC6316_1942 [Bifidobacterium longum]PKC85114.1 hypothetical protein DPC6316_1109 [Bifidobacterium longum]
MRKRSSKGGGAQRSILGFRCFFFFAYKYLYTCLAGTPAQPYSHKG